MKKTLLAVALASASCLAAYADGKVAIVVQNEPYYGNANEIVTVYVGDENPTWVSSAFKLELVNLDEAKPDPSAQVNCSFHWYPQTTGILTPAPGVTITKIEVETPVTYPDGINGKEDYKYTIPLNSDFKVDYSTMTWAGSLSAGQEMTMTPAKQSRFTIMEVTYTGTPATPAIPVPDVEPTVITCSTPIKLTTETSGAQIYYTVDGSEPTTSSTLYTAPITLWPAGNYTIKAIAVKDGQSSYVASYTYAVVESGLEVVMYDFRDYESLTIPNKEFPTSKPTNSANWISLNNTMLVNEDVTIDIMKEADGTNPRLRRSINGLFVEMVFVGGNMMVISVPEDKYIGAVLIAGSGLNSITNNSEADGTFAKGGYKNSYILWRANEGKRVDTVEIGTASGNTNSIDNIYVCYAPKTNSGIDAIEMGNSNAPVVYYNLQGMQVAADSLTPGIYIKRQGTKAEKIYVK